MCLLALQPVSNCGRAKTRFRHPQLMDILRLGPVPACIVPPDAQNEIIFMIILAVPPFLFHMSLRSHIVNG